MGLGGFILGIGFERRSNCRTFYRASRKCNIGGTKCASNVLGLGDCWSNGYIGLPPTNRGKSNRSIELPLQNCQNVFYYFLVIFLINLRTLNLQKTISSLEELIMNIDQGKVFNYLYFWGHQKSKSGISKSCMSQWYEAPFTHNNTPYPTAEHYMMAEKARLFNDTETEKEILSTTNPRIAKQLGRKIKNFNENKWLENRRRIVIEANQHKFLQNPELRSFLISTHEQILVEASPNDSIWGIGLSVDQEEIKNPHKWCGQNLLGFSLMQVRELIRM